METIITVIVVLLLLIVFGVIMYITFENMEYRQSTYKTMGNTVSHVKNIDTGFDAMSSNIDIMSSNIIIVDNNEKNNREAIKSMSSNIQDNQQNVKTNSEKLQEIANNIDENGRIVTGVSNNMSNLDNNLKKYFNFSDNQEALNNDRLFEHRLSGIEPELDLISLVTATGGMIVKTPEQIEHDKNMKICNEQNNCIQLNVNSDGFNVTPDNLNKMTINAKDKQPMAMFDMENKSIYLGGVDNTSPLFIENGELYANKLNIKENGLWSEFSTPKLSDQNVKPQPNVVPPIKAKDVIASYTFVSSLKNMKHGAIYTDEDAEFMQLFILNINSKHNLNEGDTIIVIIPTLKIGQLEGTLGQEDIDGKTSLELYNMIQKDEYYVQELVSNKKDKFTDVFNIHKIDKQYFQFHIKIAKNIEAGKQIRFELIGVNMLEREAESHFEIISEIPVTVEYTKSNDNSI